MILAGLLIALGLVMAIEIIIKIVLFRKLKNIDGYHGVHRGDRKVIGKFGDEKSVPRKQVSYSMPSN